MKPTVETKEQYLQFVTEWKKALNTLVQRIKYYRGQKVDAPSKEDYDNARKAVIDLSEQLGNDGRFEETRKGYGFFLNYVTPYSTDSRMVNWLLRIRKEYKIKAAEAKKAATM